MLYACLFAENMHSIPFISRLRKKNEKKIREMPIKNVTLQHAFSLSGRVLSGLGGNDFGNMLFLQYIQGEIRMLSR